MGVGLFLIHYSAPYFNPETRTIQMDFPWQFRLEIHTARLHEKLEGRPKFTAGWTGENDGEESTFLFKS